MSMRGVNQRPCRFGTGGSTAAIVLAILLGTPVGVAAQLPDSVLLERGVEAYRLLPPMVSPVDAPTFAEAVKYLFAYEQRDPPRMRADGEHQQEVLSALEWLAANMDRLRPAGGKGDGSDRIRPTSELKAKGLDEYAHLPERDQEISAVDGAAYISALANLFAYAQRDPQGAQSMAVRSALARLDANLLRLRASIGKGDAYEWTPSAPKPSLWEVAVTEYTGVSGIWRDEDGGIYFVRQVEDQVWWFGQSRDGGRTWTNVFHGALKADRITGKWANVPIGQWWNYGELDLRIDSSDRLTAIRRTGAFGGRVWVRVPDQKG